MTRPPEEQTSTRSLALATVWPAVLAVALTWPLLTRGGHPLARDLVFLPSHELTWNALGLGDGAPRAVPLDAWIALLTRLVDGGVLARILLPGLLVLAAVGVMRLLPWLGASGRVVAGGVAVWNPFEVERLALGQWALLAGYAALPWLVAACIRRERERDVASLAPVIGWASLASITPTGGLMALLVVGLRWLRRRPASGAPLVAVLLIQAPWVVAGLVGTASPVSDPAGVSAFAPDTESRWGTWVALVGMGGIWDSRSEPASRLTFLAPLTALVVVIVLVVACGELRRRLPDLASWSVMALGGLGWALLVTTGPGLDLAGFVVGHLPGAGLLRDAQKLLLPFVLLLALAAGVAADRAVRVLTRSFAGSPQTVAALMLPLFLAPVVLLPDGARLTWRTVNPVVIPDSFAAVDEITAGSDGYLVTLPWRSYRLFTWGNEQTASDPATRALRIPVVTSDDLLVGSTLVRGEGRLSQEIGTLLQQETPPSELGALGVGWVLVYSDDPDAGDVDVSGLDEVYDDKNLTLYSIPGATAAQDPSLEARVLLGGAHALVLLLLGAALTSTLARMRYRQSSDRRRRIL